MTACIIFYTCSFVILYEIFTFTEMTVLKCLFIFKWPYMAMLDDYHITLFLHLMNVLLAGLIILSRCILAEYMTNKHISGFAKGFQHYNYHPIEQWHPTIKFW